ncbi:MAG: FmdB family zinc ribbon protein [Planctomycetota bacterium]
MPTYDYCCNACDHEFEYFQSINSPVKRKCPACGQLKLKRLIGPGAAIMFKGSGFYETDYRSESYKKRAAEEKEAASPSKESKGESKGESKSDGKADQPKTESKGKATSNETSSGSSAASKGGE